MENIALITGATSGIGKAAALCLAKKGYRVIIHGRDVVKTEIIKKEIIDISGNRQISTIIGDLFSIADIHKMSKEVRHQFSRLDILINNAGSLMSKERQQTKDEIERTFAVNVTAPFLLTHLLLDLLQESKDARIINVASNSHRLNAQPDFNDIELKNGYTPLRAYGNAKLFLIWNTQHLAKLLLTEGFEQIKAFTVHPGAVATEFGGTSDLGTILNLISRLARPFFRTAEKGADTLVFLATENELPGKTGDYFVDRKPTKTSVKYHTPEKELFIWNYCMEQVAIKCYFYSANRYFL